MPFKRISNMSHAYSDGQSCMQYGFCSVSECYAVQLAGAACGTAWPFTDSHSKGTLLLGCVGDLGT
jgi:hypothetical protein